MILHSLEINNFRNLARAELSLCPAFNLFYGNNGAGKTSLLEAIYYLSHGKSFRARSIANIIGYHAGSFLLFANLIEGTGQQLPLGVESSRSGTAQIHLGGNAIYKKSQLATTLPLQLINPDSYFLLESGPKYRRQFLDWGLFHVEQCFLQCWQQVARGIKQRNSALRSHAPRAQIESWDSELVPLFVELNSMRIQYVEDLAPILEDLLHAVLGDTHTVSCDYYPGWSSDSDLSQQLSSSYLQDLQRGFTSVGPHRADLCFSVNGLPVTDVLSRGQEKLLVCVLQLAQGIMLFNKLGKQSIYLVDDLPSELDCNRRQLLIDVMRGIGAQVFVTGINQSDLLALNVGDDFNLFHVEHGVVSARP